LWKTPVEKNYFNNYNNLVFLQKKKKTQLRNKSTLKEE